jgi:hypothetical protein
VIDAVRSGRCRSADDEAVGRAALRAARADGLTPVDAGVGRRVEDDRDRCCLLDAVTVVTDEDAILPLTRRS